MTLLRIRQQLIEAMSPGITPISNEGAINLLKDVAPPKVERDKGLATRVSSELLAFTVIQRVLSVTSQLISFSFAI